MYRISGVNLRVARPGYPSDTASLGYLSMIYPCFKEPPHLRLSPAYKVFVTEIRSRETSVGGG